MYYFPSHQIIKIPETRAELNCNLYSVNIIARVYNAETGKALLFDDRKNIKGNCKRGEFRMIVIHEKQNIFADLFPDANILNQYGLDRVVCNFSEIIFLGVAALIPGKIVLESWKFTAQTQTVY